MGPAPTDSWSLQRYASARRKLTTALKRQPWRHRAKRRALRRTSTEKQALKAKRREKKEAYSKALEEARAAMWEQAALMRERFGSHTLEYYVREIMQDARLNKTRRAPSRWNAFLSLEVQRLNQGQCSNSPSTQSYLLTKTC